MYAKYAKLRDDRGLRDVDVTRNTGVSSTTLSEWKSGKATPKLDKIAKIAAFFEVPIEYFVKED